MVSSSHPPIILYTAPTCSDCNTLKAWFGHEGIAFEERDLSKREVMEEVRARTGVRLAPITLIGDAFFQGTFLTQKPLLTAALGLSRAI